MPIPKKCKWLDKNGITCGNADCPVYGNTHPTDCDKDNCNWFEEQTVVIAGDWDTRHVFIDGVELLPARSQKLYNHSPDGFNWGYGGSGPAQLALALLLKFTTMEKAMRLHQQFKWDVIATLPQGNFALQASVIELWLEKHQ
jgi:hypothetical protein